MAATLTQVRTALRTTCDSITTANRYRFMPKSPQFPAIVIGMPEEYDVRADESGGRTMTVPVWCGVEGRDDESTEDEFMSLIESAVTALLASQTLGAVVESFDVLPATNFSASQTGDDRIILWGAIPCEVFA